VFYLTEAESLESTTGTLAVAVDGQEAVELGTGSAGTVGRVISNGINLWSGTGTPESRLVRWTPEGELTELSTDVVDFRVESYPERVLIERDGGEFDVLDVEGDDEPRVIAARAIDLGRSSVSSTLLGRDVEGDVGTLRYADGENSSVTDVAEDVFLPTASFSFSAEVILYLDRYDLESAVGRLCIRIVDTADEFCETDVSGFRRMIRPERGVAYVKSRDGEQRLFWAPME
jgi:hypothetical protein